MSLQCCAATKGAQLSTRPALDPLAAGVQLRTATRLLDLALILQDVVTNLVGLVQQTLTLAKNCPPKYSGLLGLDSSRC